jgi:ubiquitin carboxyl-terminal hydrolase 5/13
MQGEITLFGYFPICLMVTELYSNRALLTIISHYVAFIRKQDPKDMHIAWVLYNDEKVVKADDVEEMKKFAYVYFFKHL